VISSVKYGLTERSKG